MTSTELPFPSRSVGLSFDCIDLCRKLLRRNPVERLTFQEFFNHPFLSQKLTNKTSRSLRSQRIDGFPVESSHPSSSTNEKSQEEHLPCGLDDECGDHDRNPSHTKRPPLRSACRISLNARSEQKDVHNFLSNMDLSSKYISGNHKPELVASEENLRESLKSVDSQAVDVPSKVVDSFELIAREYVIVSNPPLDMSSDSITELNHLETKLMSPLLGENVIKLISNIPVTIITTTTKDSCNGCLENHSSAPSGTSLESFVIRVTF